MELPTSREPRHNIQLAYYYLGLRNYKKALEYLQRSSKIMGYTHEELRLLGWVFLQYQATQDYTPEAKALRLYAAWLVHENQIRHPTTLSKNDSQEDIKFSLRFSPKMAPILAGRN